jgi:AraC-like DNA-binding protein
MSAEAARVSMLHGVSPERFRLSGGVELILVRRGACRAHWPCGRSAHAMLGSVLVPRSGSPSDDALELELVSRAPVELACFELRDRTERRQSLVLTPGELAREPRLAALRDLLDRECTRSPVSPEVMAHLVEAFLIGASEHRACPRSPSDPLVTRALEQMRRELARRLSVAELARSVGLSRAAFARRFRAELGEPPERYLSRLRMQRAAELLGSTDAGLAAIAAEIGYGSEFAFSRAFKRCFGVSPSGYRRQVRAVPAVTSSAPRMAA